MYCNNCNHSLPEGSKFCNKCGTEIIAQKKIREILQEEIALQTEIEKNLSKEIEIVLQAEIEKTLSKETEKTIIQNEPEDTSGNYHNGLILNSPNPLDDGLRKYNFIYYTCFILGALWSFTFKGTRYDFFIICGLVGMLLAWIIKTVIASVKMHKLRQIQFNLPFDTDNSYLYDVVSLELSQYGMFVEKSAYGLCITHNGIIYDLGLNDNSTFSLWWRLTIVKAILSRRTYINLYRKAVVSMGLIAYIIQQRIGQNNDINYSENKNPHPKPEIKKPSTNTKILIAMSAIIIIWLSFVYINNEIKEAINTPTEDVELHNLIYGTDYDVYDYIRRDNWWNKLIGKYSEEKEREEIRQYYLKKAMEETELDTKVSGIPTPTFCPTVIPTPELSQLEIKYQYYNEHYALQTKSVPEGDLDFIESSLANSPYYGTWYHYNDPDSSIVINKSTRNGKEYGIKNITPISSDSAVGFVYYYYLDEPDHVYEDRFWLGSDDGYMYDLMEEDGTMYSSITIEKYNRYISENGHGNDPAFYEEDYYNPYTLDDIYPYAVDYASDAIIDVLNLSQVDLLYGGFYPDKKSDMYFEYDGNYTYYLTFEIYYHYFADYYYYRAEFTFTDKDKNHNLVMRNASVRRK